MAPKKKIKQYEGNRAKLILQLKAVEKDDHLVGDQLFDQIKMELGITSNILSYLLNNNSKRLLSEAWIISQVLEVDIKDLVRVKKSNSLTKEASNQNDYGRIGY